MRDLGRQLAALLRAGDLVILTGPLGVGKTTLVQGIGAGLRRANCPANLSRRQME
jgi:tRNA threonylcarbamoyladenosine biosynthesis protein TsaE